MRNVCILLTFIFSLSNLAAQSPIEVSDSTTRPIEELAETDSLPNSTQIEHNDTIWKNYALGTRVHLQRLNGVDTLVSTNHSVIKPILESLATNFVVWGYDHFITDRGWADVNIHDIRHNLQCSWVLDEDSYSGNQFSHPVHGAVFYNTARYHGHSYYSSALYPLIGSCVWEYFCEKNEPSYNDFLSTGIGGSAIGEVTFRASDIVFDNSKTGVRRVIRELVGTVLNPARGFHRIISGEMWRVSPSRGKHISPEPFSLDVGVGNRFMREFRHKNRHKNVLYVDFLMDYGEHFDGKDSHSPFDYFRIYGLLNLSGNDPTFSRIDIKGRVATKQFSTSKGWIHDVGLYQVYKYIDNYGDKESQRPGDYALLNEACSFAGGLYSEKVWRMVSFSNDFMFDAVGFGGTTADYYKVRRYNFASGFSLSNDIRFCINNKLVAGYEFYFARLFSLKGSKVGDPTDRNKWFWGDKGNHSIIMSRTYMDIFLKHDLKLNFEHQLYYRRSNYECYPHVHAKSHELKIGLIYSI